ncbi:amino acid permease [Thozetella sp. PMI_491]|nr:amino acid permease [Thozetella sp. PMI_491]
MDKISTKLDRANSLLEAKPGTANADAERLAQLGLEDRLERSFSLPALIALCLCLMGTWEACGAVIAQALTNGGAPCLWYNFLITFLCSIAIGASLGEIASIYPTSGGQYHWVTALAPDSINRGTAWITGWISIGGQIVLTASAAFLASVMVQGLILLGNETYEGERWHTMLIYWALLIYAALMNTVAIKALPTANIVSGAIHIAGFVAIFGVLAAMANKNASSYVFTEIYNASGWENDGVSWLVGLISSVYPFLGYDAACHLAEELPDASRNVPLAMIGSIIANGLMGLAYCTMLLYSSRPLESLLATPTGLPFLQIYLDATNSTAGTTIMALVHVLTAIAAAFAGITSTSRTLWAFARDDATPFHKWLSQVGTKSKIPSNAIMVVVGLEMLLGLIYLGNSTAFNAILSMAIIGMYLSYLLPIVLMLCYGRQKLQPSEYGPFKLGYWLGTLLNIVSILWGTLAIIFSTFPSILPATQENMNYSIVVMSGWAVFGAIYYVIYGRKKFQMPVVEASVVFGLGGE